jgi:SAM-dependent methyltransferase
VKQHDPTAEIAAGNPWYVADQFQSQTGSRGRKRVIEDRWRVFASFVRDWRQQHPAIDEVRALDAGCGDGINLRALRDIATGEGLGLRLHALDYNVLRLGRASRLAGDAHLLCASLHGLPFADDTFDLVLANHVIEHLPDVRQALSEIRRVLHPRGLLIIGVPNEGCLLARARNHVIQPSIGRTTDHVNFFTAESLVRTLQETRLAVWRVERETFFFPCSYVNAGCNEFRVGHAVMAGLRRLFPSQAGGLIVAAGRSARRPG